MCGHGLPYKEGCILHTPLPVIYAHYACGLFHREGVGVPAPLPPPCTIHTEYLTRRGRVGSGEEGCRWEREALLHGAECVSQAEPWAEEKRRGARIMRTFCEIMQCMQFAVCLCAATIMHAVSTRSRSLHAI